MFFLYWSTHVRENAFSGCLRHQTDVFIGRTKVVWIYRSLPAPIPPTIKLTDVAWPSGFEFNPSSEEIRRNVLRRCVRYVDACHRDFEIASGRVRCSVTSRASVFPILCVGATNKVCHARAPRPLLHAWPAPARRFAPKPLLSGEVSG